MTAPTIDDLRPITVRPSRTRRGQWFWRCRHCSPLEMDYAPTAAAAHDAGTDHVKVCPWVIQCLDRLISQVMAVPEFRTLYLTRTVRMVACVRCGYAIDDADKHTADHLAAAEEATFRG